MPRKKPWKFKIPMIMNSANTTYKVMLQMLKVYLPISTAKWVKHHILNILFA